VLGELSPRHALLTTPVGRNIPPAMARRFARGPQGVDWPRTDVAGATGGSEWRRSRRNAWRAEPKNWRRLCRRGEHDECHTRNTLTPELSRTAREPVWADAATKRFRLERLVMPLRPRMHPGSPHKTRRCRDVPWSCNDLGKALQVSLASSLAMLRLQRFSSMFPASAAVGQRRAHLSDLSQPP
jgi:hypothetical protein